MSQLKIPQNNQQFINQQFKIKFIFLGKLIAIPRSVNRKKLKNYEYRRFYNEGSEDNLEIADYSERKWTSGDRARAFASCGAQ
jgi:hypothetical protein